MKILITESKKWTRTETHVPETATIIKFSTVGGRYHLNFSADVWGYSSIEIAAHSTNLDFLNKFCHECKISLEDIKDPSKRYTAEGYYEAIHHYCFASDTNKLKEVLKVFINEYKLPYLYSQEINNFINREHAIQKPGYLPPTRKEQTTSSPSNYDAVQTHQNISGRYSKCIVS